MTMGPVGKAYAALVAAGELKPDDDQKRAVQALDRFGHDAAGQDAGFFKKLFGKKELPRGIYLWGGVGRGKSMLMDLAFDNIDIRPKRRAHFHAFMIEVHGRLREARKSEEGDPVVRVAEQIAEEVKFLAFDEMMVTNSADAMIMSRLFTAMIDEGVAIVTTSNRPPGDLYKDGLNRELFLPFIDLIER
jgi:cell division protein ZapE